jgi:hypothetical protein
VKNLRVQRVSQDGGRDVAQDAPRPGFAPSLSLGCSTLFVDGPFVLPSAEHAAMLAQVHAFGVALRTSGLQLRSRPYHGIRRIKQQLSTFEAQ